MAENAELLRKAGAMDVPEDDGADHLRADILGSIVGSDPRLPNYLGRINNLITAHGAVGNKTSTAMNPPEAVPGGDPGMTSSTTRPTPTALPDTSAPVMGTQPKPGLLGRIGHAAARMGNIAGDIFAPGITALIPGTDLNKRITAEKAERTSERQRQLATEETSARAKETEAETGAKREALEEKTAGQPKPKEESWKEFPGYEGPSGEPLEIEQNSGNVRSAVSQLPVKSMTRVEKPGTQEQNKLGFQNVIGKLDAAGLPTGPKDIDRSLDSAKKRGIITDQEHSTARAYQAANPTPGTNLTVRVAGLEAGQQIKDASKYYIYNGKIVKGSEVPANADAFPVKDPEAARKSIASTDATVRSFGRYQKSFNSERDKLTPADLKSLETLTSDAGEHNFVNSITGAISDIVAGKPLTGYSEKVMGGWLTRDQYEKMSPSAKKLLVDYYNAVIQNFADMKQRTGAVGRNESMIRAEMHTVPLPYVDKASAADMFADKLADVKNNNWIYKETHPEGEGGGKAPAPF